MSPTKCGVQSRVYREPVGVGWCGLPRPDMKRCSHNIIDVPCRMPFTLEGFCAVLCTVQEVTTAEERSSESVSRVLQILLTLTYHPLYEMQASGVRVAASKSCWCALI